MIICSIPLVTGILYDVFEHCTLKSLLKSASHLHQIVDLMVYMYMCLQNLARFQVSYIVSCKWLHISWLEMLFIFSICYPRWLLINQCVNVFADFIGPTYWQHNSWPKKPSFYPFILCETTSIINNGSHCINALHFLFLRIKTIQTLKRKEQT